MSISCSTRFADRVKLGCVWIFQIKKKNQQKRCLKIYFLQFPTLSPYNEYCANQADAKETLDAVVNREDRVRDFLQRCLESPFSRKLDLWSYLDLPRSRLVKYPLLLKAIHKVTPQDHPDSSLLAKAVSESLIVMTCSLNFTNYYRKWRIQ